jgi:hypothetical protein
MWGFSKFKETMCNTYMLNACSSVKLSFPTFSYTHITQEKPKSHRLVLVLLMHDITLVSIGFLFQGLLILKN